MVRTPWWRVLVLGGDMYWSYTGGEDGIVVGTGGRHVLDDTVESDTGGEDDVMT